MCSLNRNQEQLLFIYCLGLTTDPETMQAKTLVSQNTDAAVICSDLKRALAPFKTLKSNPCPDTLAESTLSRIASLFQI